MLIKEMEMVMEIRSRVATTASRFCFSTLIVGSMAFGMPGAFAQSVTGGPDTTIQRVCTDFCVQASEDLAVDRAGNAIAIWVEITGTESSRRIVVSRFDAAAGQWSTPKVLANESYGNSPSIGMDAQGNAIAVWEYYLGEGTDTLRYSRYSAETGTWTALRNITEFIPSDFNSLSITVGRNGDAFVQLGGRNDDGGFYRFDSATETWSGLERVATAMAKVALDSSGNALIADEDPVIGSPPGYIEAKRFDAATNTYTSRVLLDVAQDARDPNTGQKLTETRFQLLAVSKDRYGSEMVLWEKTVKSNETGAITRELKSARYLPRTGTWADKQVPKLSNSNTLAGKMSADRFGSVNAVWTQWTGGYAKTVSARYSSSTGKWTYPRVISQGNFHTRDASLDTDYNGNVIATWSQRTDTGMGSSDGKVFRTTAARYKLSWDSWGTPSTIQDVERDGYRPFMGVDDSGRAVVIWNQDSWRVIDGKRIKVLRADRVIPK
jgi:hypothetical protein